MYDLNKEFNTFYDEYVILEPEAIKSLHTKKNLNIERLENGLAEYNEEKGTKYKLAEHVVQGSVAMSTVTQNEKNEYDIDVAIVFDSDNLPDGDTRATKNMVLNALEKKTYLFKQAPEFKTNCIRVVYSEGYHIDFAVYRRTKTINDDYFYEHAGSQWRKRDPKVITNWFAEQDDDKDNNLRKITRLIKMFSTSRKHWNMPGGLILSVLCNEQYSNNERLDEMFYKTIVKIRNRLQNYTAVYNPTDITQSLLLIKEDDSRMRNLLTRLNDYISKLDVLFESDCSRDEALSVWSDFFNHDFWKEQLTEGTSARVLTEVYSAPDEAYIQNDFQVLNDKFVRIDCEVTDNLHRTKSLRAMLANNETIDVGSSLRYFIRAAKVSTPYDVWWKVKNRGEEAKRKNCLRGEIAPDKDGAKGVRKETASFIGHHYVECYLIKNGICVATSRIDVPIR